ncbi:MAG: type II toxin-antitoxin system RelE/ParE family toxin [Candidatus Peregrinibacteria bacterium]|nr:type II toxin-antitoxin system RelE/ParE family toxin [Candidatus Peregrinibacteria bacterium]
MYLVILKPTARKHLRKLPHRDQERISLALEHLAENPFFGKKLDRELTGFYSMRVWPYRIVYIIEQKIITVTVVSIGHRKDVYRRLG